MVSMKDIAKACDVSVATVSKALSGQQDIGEETRKRIARKAEELGYMANASARALKTNRTYNIGVLFVDPMHGGLAHEFFSGVLDGIREEAEKNGYDDPLTDVGEVFGIWVIEGPDGLEDRLPFKKAGVPVIVVPDVTPYKKRKVRILNGAHTGFTLGAYLAGFDIVRDCMHDDTVRGFMNKMLYEEVIPTLPLDRKDLEDFASAVQDRFNNPFVNHELMSISLNSTSKWRARNMPSFLEYVEAKKELPPCLTASLAAYIAFYSNEPQELTDKGLVCRRPKGNDYTVSDDRDVLEFYWEHRGDTAAQLVHAVLTNEKMWGQDLTQVAGLEKAVTEGLETVRKDGAAALFRSCL